MHYNFMPTLEHKALVNITAILWNNQDVRALVKNFSNSPFYEFDPFTQVPVSDRTKIWHGIEDTVREKVSQLIIARTVKKKLLHYIQPVGLQILRWMIYHFRNYASDLPNQFFWTAQGIIDRKKTAEMLIKDNSIDVNLRYKLACLYCCEEDIPKLWNEISEDTRSIFYNIEYLSNVKQEMVAFWTRYARGELPRMDDLIIDKFNPNYSTYLYAFQCAAESGNTVATKYFLQKLTLESETLVNAAIHIANKLREFIRNNNDPPKEYYSDAFCFLLSEMNNEEQMKIFRKHSVIVLLCLLDWPRQHFFIEEATEQWHFLSVKYFNFLLNIISNRGSQGYTDYNYQKLFREFWQEAPIFFKREFIYDGVHSDKLYSLLENTDKENILLIFQDLTLMRRKDVLFSQTGQKICTNMVKSGEWDFLKIFIQMCISTKDEIIPFKQMFQQQTDPPFLDTDNEIYREKEQEFYQLLDDLASDDDKRKIEDEGDNDSAKRLCI